MRSEASPHPADPPAASRTAARGSHSAPPAPSPFGRSPGWGSPPSACPSCCTACSSSPAGDWGSSACARERAPRARGAGGGTARLRGAARSASPPAAASPTLTVPGITCFSDGKVRVFRHDATGGWPDHSVGRNSGHWRNSSTERCPHGSNSMPRPCLTPGKVWRGAPQLLGCRVAVPQLLPCAWRASAARSAEQLPRTLPWCRPATRRPWHGHGTALAHSARVIIPAPLGLALRSHARAGRNVPHVTLNHVCSRPRSSPPLGCVLRCTVCEASNSLRRAKLSAE